MWPVSRSPAMLMVILALSILVAPLAVEAQQPAGKMPRIGFLLTVGERMSCSHPLFLRALHELGYVEGRTILIEWRCAEGKTDWAHQFARELVQLEVDVIVTTGAPAIRAAQHVTTTIPIVIFSVGEPVAEGFVAGLARPGGNITGVGGLVGELSGKLLELLTEAVPGLARVAVFDPRNIRASPSEIERTARSLGVQLHFLEVRRPDDFERAFTAATREGAGALLLPAAILFLRNQRELAALAMKHRLPAIYWDKSFAEVSGLLAYGPNLTEIFRRLAFYVDKILRGAKPADLPMERPMTFELVINLKTAEAMGLTIPPALLFQADEVLR
jgi:putative tryptophan/tyrosine transport system substrate-binding protein